MAPHKPKLRDLSRKAPSDEESDEVHAAFASNAASPLVIAILGQAMVEYELDRLLRSRFPRIDDSGWSELTEDRGPFRNFDAKILAGRAFKLYDDDTKDHLNRIRNIRNAFAHAKMLIAFDNPLVLKELRNAALPTRQHSRLRKEVSRVRSTKISGQESYRLLCVAVFIVLAKRQIRGLKASTKNYQRRMNRAEARNPFAKAMTQGFPAGLIGSSWQSRNAGPNRLARRLTGAIPLPTLADYVPTPPEGEDEE